MESKICSKCGIEKPKSEYYADKRRPSGVQPCCKECFIKRVHIYRNSDHGKDHYKLYRKRDDVKAKNREANRKLRRSGWVKNHRYGYVRTEKHKEWRKIYEKEYRKRPHARLADSIAFERYRGRKKSTDDGTVTVDAAMNILHKQNHKCVICSCDLNKIKKHLDHIIPLSKGGAHTITNVQWLCYLCNIIKSNHVEENIHCHD
jgi:5-methylcytosine-specific restriction endonuclease McrA